MSAAVRIPMPISPDASSIAMLLEGVRQLGLVIDEIRELQDEKGQLCQVDRAIRTPGGDTIGIARTERGVDFVVPHPEKESVKKTIREVQQVYSRLRILNAVKARGYAKVKEEKLADGSIRLVVQKWRQNSK